MKILIVICLFVLFSVTFSAKTECDKLASKSEGCLKTTTFLDIYKVPKNENEYKAYNKRYSKAVQCMKDYKKCLNGLARQSYGLLVNGIVKFGKYLFAKQSNTTGIMYSFQCLSPKVLKSMHDKIYLFSVRTDYTLKNATAFDELCCAYRVMVEDVIGLVDKDNCKIGLKENKDFLRRLLNAFTEDTSALLCSKQTSVQVCNEQYSSVMDLLKTIDPKKHGNEEYVVRPFIRIIEKLSE